MRSCHKISKHHLSVYTFGYEIQLNFTWLTEKFHSCHHTNQHTSITCHVDDGFHFVFLEMLSYTFAHKSFLLGPWQVWINQHIFVGCIIRIDVDWADPPTFAFEMLNNDIAQAPSSLRNMTYVSHILNKKISTCNQNVIAKLTSIYDYTIWSSHAVLGM